MLLFEFILSFILSCLLIDSKNCILFLLQDHQPDLVLWSQIVVVAVYFVS